MSRIISNRRAPKKLRLDDEMSPKEKEIIREVVAQSTAPSTPSPAPAPQEPPALAPKAPGRFRLAVEDPAGRSAGFSAPGVWTETTFGAGPPPSAMAYADVMFSGGRSNFDFRPGFNEYTPRQPFFQRALIESRMREEIKTELLNSPLFMAGIRQEALAIVLQQQARDLQDAARRVRIPAPK